MIELGINIDHVATLRQARRGVEPSPVWAAVEAELGGADGITVHLREDRRHINDRDVHLLRQSVHCKLNLEMSLSPQIIDIAASVVPRQATFVPERPQEITTEGGLDLSADSPRVADAVRRLKKEQIAVTAFVDPEAKQVELAHALGFDAIEIHTGEYAACAGAAAQKQLQRIEDAAALAGKLGLRVHAGHSLNYHNVLPLLGIANLVELNIGHAIVSRAIFIGLRAAVRQMKDLLDRSTGSRVPCK